MILVTLPDYQLSVERLRELIEQEPPTTAWNRFRFAVGAIGQAAQSSNAPWLEPLVKELGAMASEARKGKE